MAIPATPRLIGSYHAIGLGWTLAFLDADTGTARPVATLLEAMDWISRLRLIELHALPP